MSSKELGRSKNFKLRVILGKFFDALKVSGPIRLGAPLTFLEIFMFDLAFFPVMMPKVLSTENNPKI